MEPLQGGSVAAAPAPAAPQQQPGPSAAGTAQHTEAPNTTQPVLNKPSASPKAQPSTSVVERPQPPTTNSGGRGMTALERETALQMMGMLAKYKEADPFRKPVDWEALGIPDYPSVIKQPIDLGTVREKVRAGAYASMDAWKADMALIWANCRKYNGLTHPFSKLAEKLEGAMERRMEEAITAATRELAARNEPGKGGKLKPPTGNAAPRASAAASDDSQDEQKPAPPRVGIKRANSTGDGTAAAGAAAPGGSGKPAAKRKATTAPGSSVIPGMDMDALEQLVNTPAARSLGAKRPEQLAFLQLWKNIVSSEEAAVAEAESLQHNNKRLKRTVAVAEEQVRELRIALEGEVAARRAAEEQIKDLKAEYAKLQSEHKQQNFVLEHQKQLLEQQQQVIRQVLGQKNQQQQQQQQQSQQSQQDTAPAAVQRQVTPPAGQVPQQQPAQQQAVPVDKSQRPQTQQQQQPQPAIPQHTSQGGKEDGAMQS